MVPIRVTDVVSRDGNTVSESKTVYVRAGETSEVSFGLSTVASN